MAVLGLFRRSTHVAALLAVALLSLACVQSVVMQAADAAPDVAMAMCTGAATTPASAKHGVPADKASKSCPICAAAAHAPLCAAFVSIPASSAVAWRTYPALRPLGPRGPPAFAPNARGPPISTPTI